MEETQVTQQLINHFRQYVQKFQTEGKKVIASSSFQTHSIPMLKIISEIDNTIPVYFLNTGFHFPETIFYKNQIAEKYQLHVIELESEIPKTMQRDSKNQFYFVDKPNYCCHINKVVPMNNVLTDNHVWITGVRKDQSAVRKNFEVVSDGPNGSLRYHPMLDWDNKTIWNYIHHHNIPHHPLEAKGYFSVGCEPCTAPSFNMDGERTGRWAGMKKTECGLHTNATK